MDERHGFVYITFLGSIHNKKKHVRIAVESVYGLQTWAKLKRASVSEAGDPAYFYILVVPKEKFLSIV